jgi:hypothetical protein
MGEAGPRNRKVVGALVVVATAAAFAVAWFARWIPHH